ncbi:MAG: hypothetical protein HY709_00210, partial [Candidatus Latescibacteria bacterium]|nr:hypothetical protein [Candidatus Latescibacterota bacterium]
YDLYGNYITKGWQLYEWSQANPTSFGTNIIKNGRFRGWFNGVLIGSSSKGQYHFATTVGEEVRTTLTPLTFSKPTYNGIQVDFLSDKYAFTSLASRVHNPTRVGSSDISSSKSTDYANLMGFRGTVQMGDFMRIGGTYVNVHLGRTTKSVGLTTSLKGILTTVQNRDVIRTIVIRVGDDSPDDGGGGGVLFSEQIFINGQPVNVKPRREGGFPRGGAWVADGKETILLAYTIPDPHRNKRVSFELVVANDYVVEVTSNLQTNVLNQQVFLPVARAEGNVTDGTNQRLVRFDYGLPTANEIYGFTLESQDILGFSLMGELNINNRYRRFPNINFTDHFLSSDHARAFYLTLRKTAFPWFAYGEVFSIDDDYTTSMFLPGQSGIIDYEDEERNRYELVDDNDDQDRWPDWRRVNFEPEGFLAGSTGITQAWGVFPGLDENNDFISDFNQNQNLRPDYDEPFLRYDVDPPEFLFGMDMNHNTIIDRFEDDELPDYPFKADHRGFNVYGGVEIIPGAKAYVGHAKEWLWSDDQESRDIYTLFTLNKDDVRWGRLQIFDHFRLVKDNLPDDRLLWIQVPGAVGNSQIFRDPLVAQDALIHTAFVGYAIGISHLNITNKIKYEDYRQQEDNFIGLGRVGVIPAKLENASFLGVVNKVDYLFTITEDLHVWPKWKSMYRRRTSFAQRGLEGTLNQLREVHDLSEALFMMTRYRLVPPNFWVEGGVELTKFFDILDKPGSPGDFLGVVYALQFSIAQDYLGYRVRTNIGVEHERREFTGVTETNTQSFISLYASTGEE